MLSEFHVGVMFFFFVCLFSLGGWGEGKGGDVVFYDRTIIFASSLIK